MRISELWRYPVKSMQGHRLDVAEIGEAGIAGDRQWALRDTATGLTLTARRVPELLMATPHIDGDDVVIALPDGSLTTDDRVLTRWLGRDVTLCRAGVAATYEIAVDFEDESGSEWVRWEGPSWSFHDSTRTQVSIASTGSMGEWEPRRFRPNVVVEADEGSEDRLIGQRVQIGGAVVEIVKPIDRCVITTRAQPGIDRDLDVLRRINADRGSLLGVGGLVRTSGRVEIGDEIRVIELGVDVRMSVDHERRIVRADPSRSARLRRRAERRTDAEHTRRKRERMNQRLNFAKAAPEVYKHLSALDQHIGEHIEHSLFELVKLRASMINGCAFCVDMHSADALKAGESTARLFGLAAWWETPLYTPTERAALALTDAVTAFGDRGVPDDVYDAARAEFDDEALTYLVAAIAMINFWNRMAITFQTTPMSARHGQ